jgi:hypothetical protein
LPDKEFNPNAPNEGAPVKSDVRNKVRPWKKGRVTIAGHPGDDLAPGTLNSIYKQAGIKKAGNK